MKNELQTRCECGGDIRYVPLSRLEEGLGHRAYKCDKCSKKWKFVPNNPKPIRIAG